MNGAVYSLFIAKFLSNLLIFVCPTFGHLSLDGHLQKLDVDLNTQNADERYGAERKTAIGVLINPGI